MEMDEPGKQGGQMKMDESGRHGSQMEMDEIKRSGDEMEITEMKRKDGSILYQVAGRVDTNTSTELQGRLLNGFLKCSHIVLDLEQVDYISSAGLRVLLIGEKTSAARGGSFEIAHVQPSVMEVLQMTGFGQILNIRK